MSLKLPLLHSSQYTVEVKFSLNVYICAHILIACHIDVIYLFYFHATHFYFISYLLALFLFPDMFVPPINLTKIFMKICCRISVQTVFRFLSLKIMWC